MLADIRPFTAVHYAGRKPLDLSRFIAPPYDVLDEAGRAALQAKDPNNIVNVDLPHLPAKAAGPQEVYDRAAALMRLWLKEGTLTRHTRPALHPYTQSFTHGGRTFHRRGLIALVKLSPFGAGQVVPHELTYKGPIEDRLKLMHATGMQLSPIFGLFSDPRNEVTNLLYKRLSRPDYTATLDGVKNDLWDVIDAEVENAAIDLMKDKAIYIADGHHRYTTALQYKADVEAQHGRPLPPNHPANWCMFVLVSMQDPGLLILPTHRLVSGLKNFNIEALRQALAGQFDVAAAPPAVRSSEELARHLSHAGAHAFGLYDAAGGCHVLSLKNPDILKPLEPQHSAAWRKLDVAILQRYLIDEVLQPRFGGGAELKRGYTADAAAIPDLLRREGHPIALLLQPTPLHALEELGKHGEVMPQKSTYFFPKLATGMVMNPLS